MRKYSIGFLMGGLGNQMFQIAHATAQGLRVGIDSIFPKTSYTPLQGRNTSNYIDNIFRKIKFNDSYLSHKIIQEESFEFVEINPVWDNSILFHGYFQSSKNFYGYNSEIINLFLPNDEFIEYSYLKYPELNSENTVSIHVRIGDYKQNPDIHPTISLSYIEEAIKKIGYDNHFFIFTDDKEWVKKNLKLKNMTIVNEDDYKELWIMSLCKNNIISNSTFSWWGSYININKNKRIIAPSIWFGDKGPSSKDIFEDNWELINVKNYNGELVYVD